MLIEKAMRLLELREAIKSLEQEEKELSDFFKSSGSVGLFGGVLVELSSAKRESLDRKSLENEIGKEVVAKFSKVCEYQVLRVRSVQQKVAS